MCRNSKAPLAGSSIIQEGHLIASVASAPIVFSAWLVPCSFFTMNHLTELSLQHEHDKNCLPTGIMALCVMADTGGPPHASLPNSHCEHTGAGNNPACRPQMA